MLRTDRKAGRDLLERAVSSRAERRHQAARGRRLAEERLLRRAGRGRREGDQRRDRCSLHFLGNNSKSAKKKKQGEEKSV